MEECHKQLALSFRRGYVSYEEHIGHFVPVIKEIN
jgi:hypothetical protein